MRRYLLRLFSVALIGLLSGCFFGGKPSCDKPQEYQASDTIEPLQVPDGLDSPDQSGALTIPPRSADAKKRQTDDPCLERPPDFFGR